MIGVVSSRGGLGARAFGAAAGGSEGGAPTIPFKTGLYNGAAGSVASSGSVVAKKEEFSENESNPNDESYKQMFEGAAGNFLYVV